MLFSYHRFANVACDDADTTRFPKPFSQLKRGVLTPSTPAKMLVQDDQGDSRFQEDFFSFFLLLFFFFVFVSDNFSYFLTGHFGQYRSTHTHTNSFC